MVQRVENGGLALKNRGCSTGTSAGAWKAIDEGCWRLALWPASAQPQLPQARDRAFIQPKAA